MSKESINDIIFYDHRCDYESYDMGGSIGILFGFFAFCFYWGIVECGSVFIWACFLICLFFSISGWFCYIKEIINAKQIRKKGDRLKNKK